MSIEFDLARAVVDSINTAANAGAFNLPVSAAVYVSGDLDFESVKDVFVWVIPNAADETPGDLSGNNDNTIHVNLVVGRNLQRGDVEEVEGMHELTERICYEVVQGTNQVDSTQFDWRQTDKNPLWDHDAIGLNIFKAERLMQFYAFA